MRKREKRLPVVQGTEELLYGMRFVAGSEKIVEKDVSQEIKSELGKQNGIEQEVFDNV